MANTATPFGLRPVRHLDGSPWNGQLKRWYIHASYAIALYIGDPVVYGTELDYADPLGLYPNCLLSDGATTTVINGVIVGFEPLVTDLTKQYHPASTAGYALVCTTHDTIFQIKDDGAGTPSKVFVGQNATMTASGGSTITGLSGYQLDTSTPTTTQAHGLHILGLSDIEGNTLADYGIWDVAISTCFNATGRWLGVTAT